MEFDTNLTITQGRKAAVISASESGAKVYNVTRGDLSHRPNPSAVDALINHLDDMKKLVLLPHIAQILWASLSMLKRPERLWSATILMRK